MHPATVSIVIINVIVFVAMVAAGSGNVIIFSPSELVQFGASSGVETIARSETWRLLASAFVHGGLLHLAVNMFVLAKIGPDIESTFGWKRYLAIYVFAAVCGGLGSVFAHPVTLNVGASAAIFGLFGALLAIAWRRPHQFPSGFLKMQMKMLVGLAFYSIVVGMYDHTMDHAAHGAGLLAGFLAGWVLLPDTHRFAIRLSALTLGAAALTALALAYIPNNGAVCFARAASLHNAGDDKQAIAILDRAIKCNPKIAVAYNNRAWSECAIHDFPRALSDANHSLELDPKAATTYDTRAVTYILLGRNQDAINDLNKAIALGNDPAYYYHRAVAKQAVGDQSFVDDQQRGADFKPEHWEPKLY